MNAVEEVAVVVVVVDAAVAVAGVRHRKPRIIL
jgi:hypothetical protein